MFGFDPNLLVEVERQFYKFVESTSEDIVGRPWTLMSKQNLGQTLQDKLRNLQVEITGYESFYADVRLEIGDFQDLDISINWYTK